MQQLTWIDRYGRYVTGPLSAYITEKYPKWAALGLTSWEKVLDYLIKELDAKQSAEIKKL